METIGTDNMMNSSGHESLSIFQNSRPAYPSPLQPGGEHIRCVKESFHESNWCSRFAQYLCSSAVKYCKKSLPGEEVEKERANDQCDGATRANFRFLDSEYSQDNHLRQQQ